MVNKKKVKTKPKSAVDTMAETIVWARKVNANAAARKKSTGEADAHSKEGKAKYKGGGGYDYRYKAPKGKMGPHKPRKK
jgi:hypothetical protein